MCRWPHNSTPSATKAPGVPERAARPANSTMDGPTYIKIIAAAGCAGYLVYHVLTSRENATRGALDKKTPSHDDVHVGHSHCIVIGAGMVGSSAAASLAAAHPNSKVTLIGPPSNDQATLCSHNDYSRVVHLGWRDSAGQHLDGDGVRSVGQYRAIEAESGVDFTRLAISRWAHPKAPRTAAMATSHSLRPPSGNAGQCTECPTVVAFFLCVCVCARARARAYHCVRVCMAPSDLGFHHGAPCLQW